MSKFNSFMNKALDLANATGKKTGEIVESSKLKLQISQLNNDLDKIYQKMGQLAYQQIKSDVNNASTLQAKAEEADALIRQIEELSDKVAEVTNQSKCESCGSNNNSGVAFCSRCGAGLAKSTTTTTTESYAQVNYSQPTTEATTEVTTETTTETTTTETTSIPQPTNFSYAPSNIDMENK